MISEQWKAVCCTSECLEQNWILFSSEVLTALCIRQCLGTFVQSQKASTALIMSVCLSASISAVHTGRIYVKFVEGFHENVLIKSKFIKIGQKRALYMKIKLCLIVSRNSKSS